MISGTYFSPPVLLNSFKLVFTRYLSSQHWYVNYIWTFAPCMIWRKSGPLEVLRKWPCKFQAWTASSLQNVLLNKDELLSQVNKSNLVEIPRKEAREYRILPDISSEYSWPRPLYCCVKRFSNINPYLHNSDLPVLWGFFNGLLHPLGPAVTECCRDQRQELEGRDSLPTTN